MTLVFLYIKSPAGRRGFFVVARGDVDLVKELQKEVQFKQGDYPDDI